MASHVYPAMPGVPAAGHIANGYWHPGRADNCTKCGTDRRPPLRSTTTVTGNTADDTASDVGSGADTSHRA